ncbi:CpsD/CapB family tyrosine-protein kinase [Ligilactobacillus salivarius]|uniref:Tyrosine-protein kinase CpsD n=1 Tax=Ligilactobacillus salivarius TaxID=1624 RepID=A0ABD7YW39_9LACO|nr:CpsD/CapB family tyrosine-protein kinase [Ligilactobacillus salivarius]WHS05449.1 CpsD/CapB family tyrosine-protein kinase [Ligilactobacillus salivarius]WHS08475.1 CpsD/CapB family tyrosine-protein kinase [Ligilactobacillus salivarius]WHS09362.1 CpsD/CapB family tyrosine-protein kinase [Ligilactobacillus salivarius]WHS13302.1 CpsD/CapB family tyrosine-protein kinase [Ligilactobacillus salivarius]WHS18076.1 CpsD/CapB family tyrosine-protein kinase [Ligilactobacillus salivarius]
MFKNKKNNKRNLNTEAQLSSKLVTVLNPKSMIAEQFRTVRTNIHYISVDEPLRKIAFTSSNSGEGKSTISSNIAVTWAQEGKKVLLIDADLHHSSIHKIFRVGNNKGLTTILASEMWDAIFKEIIIHSEVKNLDILTSGPMPPNPSELLGSKRMASLLARLGSIYDLIIFDVPPLLEVVDTQVLSDKLDGIILIARSGVTQKAAITRAVEMIQISKTRLLGYVLNDVLSENTIYGYGYDNRDE